MRRWVMALLIAALSSGAGYPVARRVGESAGAPIAQTSLVLSGAASAFHDTLAPYGRWVNVEPFGPVWQPSPTVVGRGFRPYVTGGHWVYTDYGWWFSSRWSWGWAVYHYGGWELLPDFGWVWVPGTVWAPSWCEWRVDDGFTGWAPLPPPGFAFSPGIWSPWWVFVPSGFFLCSTWSPS